MAKQGIQAMGEPAAHFFMLESGRAQCYRVTESGTEIALAMLTGGDILGINALFKQRTFYQANAAALTDCDLLVWKKAAIREVAARNPQLTENALHIVLDYLKRYVERHVNLMSKTAEQRLAITLLDLAERIGSVHPDGVEIETTNEQISSLADVTRFTTSRLLKNFERKGAVSKRRGRVVIHSPEALAIG
jgi:CRP-like cAMP-binding protein